MKTKNYFLLFLAIAASVTPFPIRAMEDLNAVDQSIDDQNTLRQDSQLEVDQPSTKANSPLMMFGGGEEETPSTATSDRRGIVQGNTRNTAGSSSATSQIARGNPGQGVAESSMSASSALNTRAPLEQPGAVGFNNKKTNLNGVNLVGDYLIGKGNEAQETAVRLREVQKKMTQASLSSEQRSQIESVSQRDRDQWDSVRCRYNKFLQGAPEGSVSEATLDQVLNLISSSNEALSAAQETLDLLGRGESVSASSAAGASSTVPVMARVPAAASARAFNDPLLATSSTAQSVATPKSAASLAATEKEKAADAAAMKSLQPRIQGAQARVDAAQAEVNRVHDSWLYALRTATKKEAIDNLVQAQTALIDLEAERARLERKATWSRLTPDQQRESERKALGFELSDKQQRLTWARLTPQEKQAQYVQLEAASNEWEAKAEESSKEQNTVLPPADEALKVIHQKIRQRQIDVAAAYANAAEWQFRGNLQVSKLYLNGVQDHELGIESLKQLSAALVGRDQGAVERYEKIAKAQFSAANAYTEAARKQSKINNSQAAEARRKEAQAYEQQAAAFARGDEADAERYKKIAKAQATAADCYESATKEQTKGDFQGAEVSRKTAQTCEDKAAALGRGDQTAAETYRKIMNAEFTLGRAYNNLFIQLQSNGPTQAVEAYRKRVLAYEEEVAALAREDKVEAEMYHEIGLAQGCVGDRYVSTAWFKSKKNNEAAEVSHKSAHAYEQQANALTRGDKASAEIYKKAAEVLIGSSGESPGAVWVYKEVACAKESNSSSLYIECRRKQAQAYEAQAEALFQRNQVLAEAHQKIAEAYNKDAIKQLQGNPQAAEVERKRAQAYEQQAAALTRGDLAAAERYRQAAEDQK